MRKRVFKSILSVTACVLVCANAAVACSRMYWNNNPNARILARNQELYMDDQVKLAVFPRGITHDGNAGANSVKWTSKYGSLVMVVFGRMDSSDEGINEKGLAVHGLYLDGTVYEKRDSRPGVDYMLAEQYLLDNAASVKEALALLKQTQIVPSKFLNKIWPLHLAMDDPSGDSAIVEFVGGKMRVYHGSQYRVMTNEPSYDKQLANLKRYRYFGGKLPLPGDTDPTSRFVRASAFLSTLPKPKDSDEGVVYLYSIAQTLSPSYGAEDTSGGKAVDAWPLLWINMYDMNNMVAYFKHITSPNMISIDIKKLNFEKGAPVLVLDPKDRSLAGEVSGSFRPYQGK